MVYGGNVKFDESPVFMENYRGNDKDELMAAIALSDFDPVGENELGFKKGNIIFLIDADPKEEWWEGGIDKRTGYFPKLFVVPLNKKN